MPNDKMKILVIGLDGVDPDILFNNDRLMNFRRLMEIGCFGRLDSVDSDTSTLAWLCMATSQVSDFAEDADHKMMDLDAVHGRTIWGLIETQGKDVMVVGIPPGYYYPTELASRVGDNTITEVSGANLDEAKNQVYDTGQRLFDQVRQLLQGEEWGYFQFVDIGLSRLYTFSVSGEHGESLIRDYYLYLDEQLETLLELLTDDTIVLVASVPHLPEKQGGFILASANNSLLGDIEGTKYIDIVPTLLEMAGYNMPNSMQGRSLFTGINLDASAESRLSEEEEAILRERLSGLGYIS